MQIEQRPLTPWRTSSGVIVGGAYIPPAPMPSHDAEQIQAVLLAEPQDDDAGHRAVLWFSVVGTVAVVGAVLAGVI